MKKRGYRVKEIVGGPEALPLIEISLGKETLRVSGKHPVLTSQGIKLAETLTPADRILGRDGRYHTPRELWRPQLSPDQVVYNFHLDTDSTHADDHLIVANGVVTGDLFLQTLHETSPQK